MALDFAKSFYTSKRWRQCRAAYIAERVNVDGGACEECHDAQGYIVHHKVMLTAENINDPDVSLNHNNLAYVCKRCHDRFDGHWTIKKAEVVCLFDEQGQVVDRLHSPLS